MKSRININTVLPIALAVILPVLAFFTNKEMLLQGDYPLLILWFSIALLLYLLWHLIWKISNLKSSVYKLSAYVFVICSLPILEYLMADALELKLQSHHVVRVIFIIVLIMIIQYALKSQQRISGLRLEKEQLQTENYKSQLKVLRSQIDPHFLFNSLNTLRSMIRQQHSNSEEFVMSLSDFYRQTLKHNENSTLSLSGELDVLNSYLFLMKNRNE